MSGSVWAPWISSACAALLARTAWATRSVTTAARITADSDRTILSVASFGDVPASTITGKTSEDVVTINRPSTWRFAGGWGWLTVTMLGCRNAAPTRKYAAMYIGSPMRSNPEPRWPASMSAYVRSPSMLSPSAAASSHIDTGRFVWLSSTMITRKATTDAVGWYIP